MKLDSPELERRLQTQARQEMRSDPVLWRDYQTHRPRWWRGTPDSTWSEHWIPFILILSLAVAFTGLIAKWRLIAASIGIAFYATATAVFRGQRCVGNLLWGQGRWVLFCLPLSEEDLLAHKWRRYLWSWVEVSVIFTFLFGAALYRSVPRSASQLIAILAVAALQSACGLSLSLWVVRYWRASHWAYAFLPYGLIAIAFLPSNMVQSLWWAVLLTPGGWIQHGLFALSGLSGMTQSLWLIPAVALAASLPFAKVTLHRQLLEDMAGQASCDAWDEEIDSVASVETGATITRDFLRPETLWTEGGWMERLIGRWFTSREKTVAEFMLGGVRQQWTKEWIRGMAVAVVGIAASAVSLPDWTVILPITLWCLAAFWCLPIAGGSWKGFGGRWASGHMIPVYGLFPVDHDEISGVILKTNFVRLLPWMPAGIAGAALIAERFAHSPMRSLSFGIGLAVILCVIQPGMVAVQSMGFRSKSINWRGLAFTLASLLAIATVCSVCIIAFGVSFLGIWLSAMLASSVGSALLWVGVRSAFNHGAFDLLSSPFDIEG